MGLWSTYRDPKRIKKICQLLEIAWSRYPDQRLGQFLLNYVFGSIGRDLHIYRREDNDVETLLKAVIEKFDAFEKLSEAEKKEQKDLYRERILEKNSKYVNKLKDD